MSNHNGLYCTNGLKCQRKECTEQLQLCRHDSTYMQTHSDLYDENKRLRAEATSHKEREQALRDSKRQTETNASDRINTLTQQLSAARDQIAELEEELEVTKRMMMD